MTEQVLCEKIKVGAIFNDAGVAPKWFVWQKRKYEIQKITYAWKTKEGEAVLYNFSTTDGVNVFQICFNSKTTLWQLVKICE